MVLLLQGHEAAALSAAFNPDGRLVVTASADKTARIWRVFDSTQALVDDAKMVAPRCLSLSERRAAALDLAPPAWCIEMQKWPYVSPDWKDWLAFERAKAHPPLPDSADWAAWIAARRAGGAGMASGTK
jgi:hypothetical protein